METKGVLPQTDEHPGHQGNYQPYQQEPGNVTQQPAAGVAVGYTPPYQEYQQAYPASQYAGQTHVTMVTAPHPVQYVDDNMVLSVVSLFFCCILGIFAIIKSSDAKDAQQRGDYDGARLLAHGAKKLAIAGIITGCVFAALGVILGVILPLVVFASISVDQSY